MCKAEGNLASGKPMRRDCGWCGCPSSSAEHDPDEKGRCRGCRRKVEGQACQGT